MHDAEIILSRSGYSTIMDLVQIKRNAILVPTPGQTEQEYLGQHLHEKKWMYTVSQKNFNLEKALREFQQERINTARQVSGNNLQEVIEEFDSENDSKELA